MTDLRAAAELALKALEWHEEQLRQDNRQTRKAIEALRQALAQPEQEPVAWMCWNMPEERYEITTDKRRLPAGTPLFTAPPSKPCGDTK